MVEFLGLNSKRTSNMASKKLLPALALLVLPFVTTCHASVIYTFTGITASGLDSPFTPLRTEDFLFTSQQFVVSQTVVLSTGLNSCVNCGLAPGPAVVFTPNNCGGGYCADGVQFDDLAGRSGYMYYFPMGAFDRPGTYTAYNPFGGSAAFTNQGTLTVADPPAPSPEPSSVFTIFPGILATAIAYRRRKRLR